MVVVPAESRLEIEAMVQNKDIGFVHDGAPAEVKIDTFNFTRYGLLHGKVVSVSADAIARDKPQQKDTKPSDESAASARTSEPQGQELVYAARIALDETRMEVECRMVDLAPGMAVTAEIKTGQRRIIEFLLSPLLRYKQESLRGRGEGNADALSVYFAMAGCILGLSWVRSCDRTKREHRPGALAPARAVACTWKRTRAGGKA